MSLRAKRYRQKYTVDSATKRYKKLLPTMYPQLEFELASLDELELAVFAKLAELGVPTVLWDYYMAFAKRKGKCGLAFWDKTFIAEQSILIDEFIRRGLIEANLEAIADVVDVWIRARRGLPPSYQDLLVNAVVYTQWDTEGASPYLNTDDGDISKIYTPYISPAIEARFEFADTTLEPPYEDITLFWKVKGTSSYNDLSVWLWHATYGDLDIWLGNPNKSDYYLFSKNTFGSGQPIKELFDTKALVNSAQLRFLKTRSGTDLNITYAYLRIQT